MLNNRILTEKQIEAARANGRKSKGPVTPQGKFNSAHSRDGLGPLAKTIILEGESPDKFRRLLESLNAEFLPESTAEIHLVETMAVARWRQIRLWALEKATIAGKLANAPAPGPETPGETPFMIEGTAIDRTAFACEALLNRSRWPEHITRTESRHDRVYNRAMKLFYQHRAWRRQQSKDAAAIPGID